jgi:hypothetical protein
MKSAALAFLTLFLTCSVHAAVTIEGVWTAKLNGDKVSLQISLDHQDRRGHFNFGDTYSLQTASTRFEGFDPSAHESAFTLHSPAGTVSFDGSFRNGLGAGHFTFAGNDAFVREMSSLGYDNFKDEDLLVFAMHQFGPATLRELKSLGYNLNKEEVTEAAVFNVNAAMIKEFAALGYEKLKFKDAVDLRVGGVDRAYIEALRALGYRNLSAAEVAELAIIGVTPTYVRDLRDAGLTGLSANDLQELKVGNINKARIDAYRRAGYPHLTARQLSEMGVQNVTPEFIESLKAIGYDNLSPDQLVELRAMGINIDYIKQMNAIGVTDLEKIVDLRATGAGEILLKHKKH